jgi:hypothetical protein
MRDKVSEHKAIIGRRAEEVQMFAGAAIALMADPVDAQNLIEIQSMFDEIVCIANGCQKELNEIRSYLGIPKE